MLLLRQGMQKLRTSSQAAGFQLSISEILEEELAAKAYVCLHAESSDCMQRSEMWIAQ